jgi:DNA-binding LacI/PurR family transcriptional regulator
MAINKLPTAMFNQRVQQREIAQRAGVSVSTVSRVLNNSSGIRDELRQRVVAAALELGWAGVTPHPQNVLRHVSIVTPATPGSTLDPFNTDVLGGVEAECRRQGIQLNYAVLDHDPEQKSAILAKLEQINIDGLLLLGIDDSALLEHILAEELPAVIINAEHPLLPIDAFLPNNQAGSLIAMQYLIAHGHRQIMHITHRGRSTIRRRHDQYRAALEEAGIAYDPTLVLDVPLSPETVYAEMQRFLASGPPPFTAIFCANDLAAIGALRALQEAGYRIPNDVSIIGYDDLSLAAFLSPPLTTIRIERQELGARAVRGLIERAANPSQTPIRVELATRLIERQSVAAVRHAG